MSGPLALLGGGEHTDGCEPIDRRLLREAGLGHPEVAVLLAASPDRRRPWKVAEAQRYWARLGARVRFAFAGEDGAAERAAALVDDADLVVLTGGRPWLLRARLGGAGLGARLVVASRTGVPIAGSSAGAMALAAWCWSLRPHAPLTLRPGLGLVPATVVVPHLGRHGVDRWAAVTARRHPELRVVGIADRTALIGRDGAWDIVGAGTVRDFAAGARLLGQQPTAMARASQTERIRRSLSVVTRSTSSGFGASPRLSSVTTHGLGMPSSSSSDTSVGRPRARVVIPATATRLRTGMAASRVSTTTGRRPHSGCSRK